MDLEKIGGRIASSQIKRPYVYLFVAVMLTVLFAPGIYFMFLHIEPSIEKVLPQETSEIQLMESMRSQYGADMLYILLEADGVLGDVRDPESLVYINLISEKFRSREHILSVTSIADFSKENNDGNVPMDYLRVKSMFSKDPRFMFYTNDDYSKTFIQVRTDTGAESKVVSDTIDAIDEDILSLDSVNPGYGSVITGFGAIDRATYNIIISDFIKIMVYSFALMSTFLVLYFGSVKKTIFAIIVIMFSLMWTIGLTGYLNITITVVTMVASAMIMALGISYGIHTVHRYFELRENMDVKTSIVEMQKELLRAMLGSSLTTSAGFIALLFGVMPAMKNLGVILAFGILITFIVTIFVEPVILMLADKDYVKNDVKEVKKMKKR